ncbi:Inner membrane protein YgaZ [Hartmannibacter diazotrophicus]|uniref:Inner membrane protein YgaZ n=1 Tax=Hartmannibacter diazotrophicus TaxID=1482074 RepID=A0A2C9D7V9_9HYPH|nr:AzlC family ABC transporter permease [Hartmannibacter diazotrophicus]SON56259.1 Inner membrane protein YgaZ [Hartmannibacter diazotrophicus]
MNTHVSQHGATALDEFRRGVVAVAPLAVAVIPFALILGANGAAKGLSVVEIGLMSAIVFAGSSQFLAIDLWREPVPVLSLGLAALLINLRHVLMSASLSGKMNHVPKWLRYLKVFFLADEIWALAEQHATRQRLTPAYYFGLAAPLYGAWVLLTMAGAALGSLIADPRAFGFDFAFTAVFIGLVAGFWKGRGSALVAATSAIVAIAVHTLVEGAWFVVAGALAGVAMAAITARQDAA